MISYNVLTEAGRSQVSLMCSKQNKPLCSGKHYVVIVREIRPAGEEKSMLGRICERAKS